MKKSISEGIFLFLSILLIGLSVGIYILYGKKEATTVSYPSTTQEEKSEDNQISKVSKSLDKLEKSLDKNNIQTIQDAIDKLSDDTDKSELQSRLNTISLEINAVTSAEEAVVQAETIQTQDSIDYAESLVNGITNTEKKNSLQKRLDTLTTNLQTQVTPAYPTNNGSQTPTYSNDITYNQVGDEN